MATENKTITGPGWSLIVDDGDDFLLTLPECSQTIYVAIGSDDDSDSDSDPQPPAAGIIGHALAPGRDAINRALVGPGNLFARCVDSAASVIVSVTAWTPEA